MNHRFIASAAALSLALVSSFAFADAKSDQIRVKGDGTAQMIPASPKALRGKMALGTDATSSVHVGRTDGAKSIDKKPTPKPPKS